MSYFLLILGGAAAGAMLAFYGLLAFVLCLICALCLAEGADLL